MGRSSFSLVVGGFLVIALPVPLSEAAQELVAGGPIRVSPSSLVIDQHCTSPVMAAPLGRPASGSFNRDPGSVEVPSPLTLESSRQAGSGVRLHLDGRALELLRGRERVTIRDFALSTGRNVGLELHRIESFSDQTIFVAGTASGDKSLLPPDAVLMAGSVQGIPGSTAFLASARTGTNGYVTLDDTTYVISSGPNSLDVTSSPALLISNLASLGQRGGAAASCGFNEMPEIRPAASIAAGIRSFADSGGLRICNIAIDCDYQYFRMMGENETAALNYVATLVAAASSIYERDLNVALRLSYARVWTTEDPYQTCGYNGLGEFQSLFKPSGQPPHLAFKFSGCGGAAAAMGTLPCPSLPSSGMPVAAGRIQGYFPYPVANSDSSWDLYVVAHEIGHIFGSPHTHCYDPPLDRCNNTEGTCYDSAVVCTRGSTMSYCNQCGGMSNIDFEFPPPVAARMEPFIAGACMEVTGSWLFVHNDGATTLQIDSITSSDPWMRVSRSTFLIASHDSQRVAVVADWDRFISAQQSGLLGVFCTGALSSFSIPVTANRSKPLAAFSATSLSGCAPLLVRFSDQSAGKPAAWLWQFGDDSTSRLQNPEHAFTEPGVYTTKMEASNSCGTDRSPDSAVVVVNGPACHFESPVIVNRDDSLIRTYDLWRSIGKMTSAPGSIRFEIATVSRDSCGARIDNNRFLSVAPVRGWAGNSTVTVRTTDSQGCGCEGKIGVIINVPPTIQMEMPGATIITNRRAILTWSDSDPNDDARVMLYRSDSSNCTNGMAITGKPLSEDQDGHAGSLEWDVAGLPDGRYYIQAVISDDVSYAKSCARGSVVVDLTPPVTTISMSCDALDSNGWCRSEGLVALPATDNLAGVGRTTFRINHGAWTRYVRPFRVKTQGATYIEYFSADIAGNAEAIRLAVQPFKIDNRTPFISKLTQDNSRFVDGDFMSATPSFSFQLLDDGSGIDLATVRITIEPGTPTDPVVLKHGSAGFTYDTATSAARVSVSSPLALGRQTLTVSAADRVGNVASVTANFQVSGELQLEDLLLFPNPTPGPAQFTFKLSQDAEVSIRIYDLGGNLVRKMLGIACKAGYNALPWNGWSDSYGLLASGAYVYDVTARNERGSIRRLDKLAVLR